MVCRLLPAAALLMAVTPALAAPPECESIHKAFSTVATVESYRQKVDMPEMKTTFEQMVIGDVIYTREETKWSKLKLKPGGRKGILEAMAPLSAISGCKALRSETLPAGPTQVYEFMMAPPKGIPGAGTAPIRQEVWIGTRDGLVHRISGGSTTANITYGALTPPIP